LTYPLFILISALDVCPQVWYISVELAELFRLIFAPFEAEWSTGRTFQQKSFTPLDVVKGMKKYFHAGENKYNGYYNPFIGRNGVILPN
jgi:hypothetical protein